MVDVGAKRVTRRTATASARIIITAEILHALKNNALQKGDALRVGQLAGKSKGRRVSLT